MPLSTSVRIGTDVRVPGRRAGLAGLEHVVAVLHLELGAVDEVVRSRSRPVASMMTSSPWRFMTTSEPSLRDGLTVELDACRRSGPRGSLLAPCREAAPPMWKVRIVSCVPGSPMDCAAMMPTPRRC
jgi:hypothetical protein